MFDDVVEEERQIGEFAGGLMGDDGKYLIKVLETDLCPGFMELNS